MLKRLELCVNILDEYQSKSYIMITFLNHFCNDVFIKHPHANKRATLYTASLLHHAIDYNLHSLVSLQWSQVFCLLQLNVIGPRF